MKERSLISREPWWERPPEPGESEWEVPWGYLEVYSDGVIRFIQEKPKPEEIRQRRGCRMPDS